MNFATAEFFFRRLPISPPQPPLPMLPILPPSILRRSHFGFLHDWKGITGNPSCKCFSSVSDKDFSKVGKEAQLQKVGNRECPRLTMSKFLRKSSFLCQLLALLPNRSKNLTQLYLRENLSLRLVHFNAQNYTILEAGIHNTCLKNNQCCSLNSKHNVIALIFFWPWSSLLDPRMIFNKGTHS